MRIYRFERYVLGACVAVMTFSGCGGSQVTSVAASADTMPKRIQGYSAAISRMEPKASQQDLLYLASSSSEGSVYVYTYPQGRLAGTLTGFIAPRGECSDSAGDVFIVAYSNSSYTASTIYEFAHGGTDPIATLSDPDGAVGCAVDPTTGNLAASGNGVART